MKYCKYPFEGLYVYPNGDVRVCGWTYECIGNILEEDFESIWYGKKAEKIRDSIRDGSFRLCNQVACQFCANDKHEELDEEEFKKRTTVVNLPKEIDAAYDYICNHSCPSCRHEMFKVDEEYIKRIKKMQEVLYPILNQARVVSLNGNGDLFASPYVMDLIERLQPTDSEFQLAIQTNGVLFNEKNWGKLKHLQDKNISVSVTPNSFDRLTYKYLSGGHDNVDTMIENLHFISELRKAGKVKRLVLSIVVQDRNYRELPEFVHRCLEEFECDSVIIKPIFYWFALTQEEYWFKDILNPRHPYFKEYMEILKDPILKAPKVFFWGGDNIHEEKDHPATSYKTYFDGFAKILKEENPKQALEKAIKNRGYNKVAIYGVNDMSEALFNLLKGTEIEVTTFVDRYAKVDEFCGLNVQKMDDFKPEATDFMIVSNYVFLENIERDLRFRNYKGELVPYCNLIG